MRYLFSLGEDEGEGISNRRRATDPIWSIELFYIDRTVLMVDLSCTSGEMFLEKSSVFISYIRLSVSVKRSLALPPFIGLMYS